MYLKELSLPGVFEMTPQHHVDERGVFFEWFRAEPFASAVGHELPLAQANCSVSRRAVVRGIHFAETPPGQAKYVTCVSGAILDVVVDLRLGSPTFGRHDAVRLDATAHKAIYIPAGLGHGFVALTDEATVLYLCSQPYRPSVEHGVNALDPDLALPWPADMELVRSDKDRAAPTLAAAEAAGLLPAVGRLMKIVVTGAAGFIGSTFTRRVLGGSYPAWEGADVVALDSLTYAGNRANLATVAHHPHYSFVQADIRDAKAVDSVLAGADLVVHFAAESHVDRSIVGAAEFVSTNVGGTQVLLEAAVRHRLGRLVHVSTDEVYGSISSGAWPETHPLEPNSPYAASKASSDLLVRAYHRTHGLDTVTTRCSNNYGPYQFPEKIIPLFATNLMDGGTVPLYGDGGNARDWLHVDDHCDGIALVAAGGRAGEVYNIGGGTELTNRELTELLLRATGTDWDRVRAVPDRLGHDRRYSVDITKISNELGFEPRVQFVDGLRATVAWYRDNREWWEPLRRKDSVSL